MAISRAQAPTKGPRAEARPTRLVWLVGGFAAGLAALGIGGAAWWWSTSPTEPYPPPAPPAATIADGLPAGAATTAAQSALPATESLAELLNGRSSDWRMARLATNPRILVIEFPNLSAQGEALNRLGALVEKRRAPRDLVLSDHGLQRLIQQSGDTRESFYFGHDYTAEAIARFFTLAVNQQMRLNPSEIRLANMLVEAGLLREENDRMVAAAGRQAMVSFTAVQVDDPRTPVDEGVDAVRREAVLRHELSHGEFFTNAAYRQHCWAFWQGLSDDERNWFRVFLTQLDYDPRNEELMVNEAQAFLMHTPDRRAFSSNLFGIPNARLEQLRARFRKGMPPVSFQSIEAPGR